MAPRSAKSAESRSGRTSKGRGFTTRESNALRDSLRISPSPTSLTFAPSQKPKRHIELESSPISVNEPPTLITIQMPNRDVLVISTDKIVSIEFERDFMDVTSFSNKNKVYKVDKGTFTIKGKM